jgi:hypothetical protein
LGGVLGASILSITWGFILGAVAGGIPTLMHVLHVWGRLHFISEKRILKRKDDIVRDLASKATRWDILGKFEIDWKTGNVVPNAAETPTSSGADDLFTNVPSEIEKSDAD